MDYEFRGAREAAWAVAVAVLTVLATAAMTLDPDTVVDWRAWAIGVAAACVRAAGGALLAWLGTRREGE